MVWLKRLVLSGSCGAIASSFFNLSTLIAKEDEFKKNLQLHQVQVIFRHGARTPVYSHKIENTSFTDAIWDKEKLSKTLDHSNIPFSLRLNSGKICKEISLDNVYQDRPKLTGGMTVGQLTTVGQQQAYDLGQLFNKEYIQKFQLLSDHYLHSEVRVQSTNVRRTILTARSVVAGMYGKSNIKETLIINTMPFEEEYLLPNWSHCLRLKDRFEFLQKYMKYLPSQDEVLYFNRLIENTDQENMIQFVPLHDIMVCREAHGFEVPKELKKVEKHLVRRASENQARILGGKDIDALRMSCGNLLNEFCEVMEQAVKDNHPYKMNLYSAHDTTLNALLMAFGKWDRYSWPRFASYIAFELYKHKEDDKHYVRVVYNKKSLLLDQETNAEYIPLERFFELLKKYRVKDWKTYCQRK
eukprot:TCONS_00070474-protein